MLYAVRLFSSLETLAFFGAAEGLSINVSSALLTSAKRETTQKHTRARPHRKLIWGTAPPLCNSWIISIICLYMVVSLNRGYPNIDPKIL